jgi:hypothetical protein
VFHATIHGGSDPIHMTGQVVPYDLEVLRQHALSRGGRGTRVEVRLAPGFRAQFLRALRDLSRRGVDLVVAS